MPFRVTLLEILLTIDTSLVQCVSAKNEDFVTFSEVTKYSPRAMLNNIRYQQKLVENSICLFVRCMQDYSNPSTKT